jgi:hypothetical protein
MEKGIMFKLTKAYSEFGSSTDCSKLEQFPGIYRLIYTLSFGGCGVPEDEMENKLENIGSLSTSEITLLGINTLAYPFILIGIHKSILYGGMKYTGRLIVLGRRALLTVGYSNPEEWLEFYNGLYITLRGKTDTESYTSMFALVSDGMLFSDGIKCEEEKGSYKCKVLATLGDLERYEEIRDAPVRRKSYLYYAIDKDLEYISKKFDFDEKLEKYKKALEKYDINKPSLVSSVMYYITGSFLKKTFTDYVKEKREGIVKRRRVVPVPLLLNENRGPKRR